MSTNTAPLNGVIRSLSDPQAQFYPSQTTTNMSNFMSTITMNNTVHPNFTSLPHPPPPNYENIPVATHFHQLTCGIISNTSSSSSKASDPFSSLTEWK